MKKFVATVCLAFAALSLAAAQSAPSSTASAPASPATTASQAAPAATTSAAAPAVSAQPAAVPAAAAIPVAAKASLPDMAKSESARYIVYSERGADKATELDARLESLFTLYSAIFHFDASLLPAKLHVREFKAKDGFDAYLSQVAGQTKDDFVYLHFANPERSELVLFAVDGAEAESSLAHQAFVQYLKAFVKNPPLWMRDGFAVYFESARWNATAKAMDLPENLAWLDTAKNLAAKNGLLPLSRVLSMTADDAKSSVDVFYPESWALASFLLNAQSREYNRLLWDSISALKPGASLADNESAVSALVSSWFGLDTADKAFHDYLDGRKTFGDLVSDGVASYGAKANDKARSSFEAAAKLDPTSYLPLYYLGLIAYSSGDYALAEYDYKSSLALGCEKATANYALGVNAFAAGRADDAKAFLAIAKDAGADRYGAKVDELLKRIK